MKHGCQGVCYGAKALDEVPVEIGKAQKSLQVFDSLRSGSVHNSSYFRLVHGDAIWANKITQESDVLMEFTFICLDV